MKLITGKTLFLLCCFTTVTISQVATARISREVSNFNQLETFENNHIYDDDDDDDNDNDYWPRHSCFCISLPHKTPNRYCGQAREKKLAENRNTYRLSVPPKVEPKNLTGVDIFQNFFFPLLELPTSTVLFLAQQDHKERKLSELYVKMVKRNKELVQETNSMPGKPFNNFCDYAELREFYRKKQFTGSADDRYFGFPSKEEYFKDIITTDDWQDDKVFVEQRLAGINPMSLRKLMATEYTSNPKRFSPDLDRAIKRVLNDDKISFLQMIQQESIFIADYQLLHKLTNLPDLHDLNTQDEREMRPSRSPIAIFVSKRNCYTKHYELKPVAIQMNFNASPEVVLPTDGSRWQMAKQEVQLADLTQVQIIEHLLKTHLMMEPICVTIKRTLSVYHPLNEILKWHCRGTFITNSIGLPNLVKQHGYMHQLLAIGDLGSVELLNKGYLTLTWNDTDFAENLKKRGVDDSEKLPYYPYRDDGMVIWNVIKEFARKYIYIYYTYSEDIDHDKELQDFANELSADGVGWTGGAGMLKHFPPKIQSTEELVDILARIIFIPIQHHAVAYPVEYYGGFVPNLPSKLYDDPRVPPGEFGIYSLHERHVASVQVALAMSLSTFRYDRLFDYYPQLCHSEAWHAVYNVHAKLMGEVTYKLRWRNRKRLRDGHLTYPYFLPNWIPNSIHA